MTTTQYRSAVEKYKDMVYTQAFYFTGNADDAADIAQDVLLKMWADRDGLVFRKVKGWLARVTRNRCIDLYRKKREVLLDAEPELPQSGTPESAALREETRRMLQECLLQLPQQLRYAVILHDIQQWKYREIASVLEIPMNSVKGYIHRGRKMMAALLTKPVDRSLHRGGRERHDPAPDRNGIRSGFEEVIV